MDIFPYREDGVKVAEESIMWNRGLYKLLDRIGYESIQEVMEGRDPVQTSALLRAAICGV